MMTTTLKRGDTKSALKATLSNEVGVTNLTGCTVNFVMAKRGSVKINRLAEIRDAGNGIVWFTFETGDTDITGVYEAEFKVEFSDGRKETFPSDSYILINIIDDLG